MAKTDTIRQLAEKAAASFEGRLGFAFRDLASGETVLLRADEPYLSASVFKVPVLLTLYDLEAKGKLCLDDPYTDRAADFSMGSGVLACLNPGVTMRLYDYAVLMMIISDNTAADICLETATREEVRRVIGELGLKHTRVDGSCKQLLADMVVVPDGMAQSEAEEKYLAGELGLNSALYTDYSRPGNYTSPADMLEVFTRLYQGRVVSEEASRKMLAVMQMCQTNSRIPKRLPEFGKDRAVVCHKTGTLPYISNDCGLVRSGERAWALALFADSWGRPAQSRDEESAQEQMLADLSKDIFDVMTA